MYPGRNPSHKPRGSGKRDVTQREGERETEREKERDMH